MLDSARLKQLLTEKYKSDPARKYQYGTAGFRMHNELLDVVVFKVGVVASMRSLQCQKSVGVMLTASHNPHQDNGVKIVEAMGDMLVPEWELSATKLCNVHDPQSFVDAVQQLAASEKIQASTNGAVIVGRDTRPSGERLLQALKDGVSCVTGVKCVDYALLTTPQLHYMVRCTNDTAYGHLSERGYYDKLATAFNELLQDVPQISGQLVIDGANGIGSLKAKQLLPLLHKLKNVRVINDHVDKPELLNMHCGSDHVKVGQQLPTMDGAQVANDTRCCSYDGDADRIVYYFQHDGKFLLLDGDYISALYAAYISSLL